MRTLLSRVSPTRRVVLSSLACLALLHCGGTTTKAAASGDGGSPTPEAGIVACGGDDGSCPTGTSCAFPIGSCSAKGECVTAQESSGPCEISQVFCGCGDAGPVYAGCSNYASAPTAGSQDCTLPNEAKGAPDAGPDSGGLKACAVTESTSPCPSACAANEVCVQQPPPDIGCVADAAADSGISCTREPGACQPTPAAAGAGCTALLNAFCSVNGPGEPDAGAYGSVGVLPSGAFVVVCENDP